MVVTLEYSDLVKKKNLTKEIEQAYGKNGLGILLVNNVPNFLKLRKELLPLARKFKNLDDDVKKKYEDKNSYYSFGWSYGVEKFKGVLDDKKGSYYNNPTMDVPTTDENLIKKYPHYCGKNIWPKKEIPEFESAFKNLGKLIVDVGELIAYQCDQYANSLNEKYDKNRIANLVKNSKCHKGRLLHYFPLLKPEKNSKPDSWCGWHLDHSALTGLTNAIFTDEKKGEEVKNKDENAGLFIRDRSGNLTRATWKDDQLAFQIGEVSQIVTNGSVVATPHCVRGTNVVGISRSTFAVFIQPNWDEKLDPPKDSDLSKIGLKGYEKGMDFNEFSKVRFDEYYN